MSMITNQSKDVSNGIVSLESLKQDVQCLCPALVPTAFHSIMFELPFSPGELPLQQKGDHQEWNPNYAILPHYKSNRVKTREGKLIPRWHLIQNAFSTKINTSRQLENAIFSYSGLPNEHCKEYKSLHEFFNQVIDKGDHDFFFQSLLPKIIDLALQVKDLFPVALPILKQHSSHSVSLCQKQIASLLANSFLCTLPFHHSNLLPSMNCDRLFQNGRNVFEKMKCLINYFRRILSSTADGVVTFSRRYIPCEKLPDWSTSSKTLRNLYISESGCIEEEGKGLLEIDFANKYIGGGVLGWGCVQEEIKFLMFPELIASRIFTELLDNTEAVIITGCEQYNKYSGYAHTFQWTGDFIDRTPKDEYGRRRSITVAIDALNFKVSEDQYKPNLIARELNKAFVGFSFGLEEGYTTAIATGNWGCGVYKGDPVLKGIIQLVAAAQCDRDVAYFTFNEESVKNDILNLFSFLKDNDAKISDIWSLLEGYSASVSKNGPVSLSEYIIKSLDKAMVTDSNDSSSVLDNKLDTTSIADNQDSFEDYDFSNFDSEMAETSDLTSKTPKEPVRASMYYLDSPEGRKMCLETEKQQWATCSMMKAKVLSATPEEPPKKKSKITDYLIKLPKS